MFILRYLKTRQYKIVTCCIVLTQVYLYTGTGQNIMQLERLAAPVFLDYMMYMCINIIIIVIILNISF